MKDTNVYTQGYNDGYYGFKPRKLDDAMYAAAFNAGVLAYRNDQLLSKSLAA